MIDDLEPRSSELDEMLHTIRTMSPALNDHDRIERLRQFEELKSAVAAAQFSEAARLDVSQRAEQAVAGEPAARQGRGIAAQVGLALRVSPWQATRGWAGRRSSPANCPPRSPPSEPG